MAQNHIGDLTMGKIDDGGADVLPTMSISIPAWSRNGGSSFLINTAKTPEGRSPGSLAWAGLANTYFWIDPARNVSWRHPDAVVAVRGQQVPGSVRGL